MDDVKKKLMEALGVSEDELRRLARKVVAPPATTKAAPQHGPVKLYKHVIKSCTCRHCGDKWTVEYDLNHGESISWLSKDWRARTYQVRSNDPMTNLHIDAYVSKCGRCRLWVLGMTHAELAERYLSLLDLFEPTLVLKFDLEREKKEKERDAKTQEGIPESEPEQNRRQTLESLFPLHLLY